MKFYLQEVMFSPFHCFMPFWFISTLFISGEREYYEKQFATLRSFEEVDSLASSHVTSEEQDREQQTQHERAMKTSNWANIFLLVFKVIYFFFQNYGHVMAWFMSFSYP